jgi:hypothetical protein
VDLFGPQQRHESPRGRHRTVSDAHDLESATGQSAWRTKYRWLSIVQTLAGFGGGAESSAYSSTPGIGAGGGGYLDDDGTYMAATVIDGTKGTLRYYVFRQSDGVGGLRQSIPAIPLDTYTFTNAYLGRSAFPNDNSTLGVVDEFRVYNEARTAAQIMADFVAGPVGGGPKLTINRSTGAITLSTAPAPLKIFQYTINSPSGALNTDNIQPISQRLDAASNGGTELRQQ